MVYNRCAGEAFFVQLSLSFLVAHWSVVHLGDGNKFGHRPKLREKQKVATCLFLNPTFTFRHICFQFVFENFKLKTFTKGEDIYRYMFFLLLALPEQPRPPHTSPKPLLTRFVRN